MKTFTTASGVTIKFNKQVRTSGGLQDVYATPMKRGEFVEKTGIEIEGDPERDGYCFLIREGTTLRWSHSPTGELVNL